MLKQAQGKLYLSLVHLMILPLSYSLLVQILLSTVSLAILSYFPAGAQQIFHFTIIFYVHKMPFTLSSSYFSLYYIHS